ncbi:MAG: protocatechuate 3,4-dioxygenase subunit alpha [Acidobacteria bacterium]|nr:protocatechuate 3,4-dioxygenase subunit alpha [Acidobacteriota bacterium]
MSEDTLVATASQTVGPFFHFGLTATPYDRLVDHFSAGTPIRLTIRVTDGDDLPVTDAMVELSQAGMFGRMATDADGRCEFETVHPSPATGHDAARRAAHILVCVFARGLLRHLFTRIYFRGDPALDDDPVLQLVPEERRHTLVAFPGEILDAPWRFNLRLQGPDETVFFNV